MDACFVAKGVWSFLVEKDGAAVAFVGRHRDDQRQADAAVGRCGGRDTGG
jgi:hypothetical protein